MYITLSMFVVQNKTFFSTNIDNHNVHETKNVYMPQANLTIYQKRTYYSGINNLPMKIKKASDNLKKFKTALKHFLYTYSFTHWTNILTDRYHSRIGVLYYRNIIYTMFLRSCFLYNIM
jgi:hypothetical protein